MLAESQSSVGSNLLLADLCFESFVFLRIFFAALGLAFLTLFSSLAMEWKSIKQGKNGQDSPTDSSPGHRDSHESATGGPTQSPPNQTEEKRSG